MNIGVPKGSKKVTKHFNSNAAKLAGSDQGTNSPRTARSMSRMHVARHFAASMIEP